VLGDGFSRGEAVAAERAVSAADAAAEPLDPDVGLQRLTRLGVLHPAPDGRWVFRHPLLRAALEEALPAGRRRQLHRLVLTELSGGAVRAGPEVIARHAALCGAHEEAFANHFQLAEEARAGHRYQDADEHFTSALAHLDDVDPRRGTVLHRRAKVRHPVQRFSDALADLAASRPYAEARGDSAALAELLLEEATVHDWSESWATSAERVEQAASLVEQAGDPALRARWLMALGRTRYRQERLDEAALHLEEAQAAARGVGDHETWAVSAMMLGMTLVSAGLLDRAEARFAEVIESCERAGDTLHLCSAYNNRIFLWLKRESLERAIADQRRATALAREIAHVQMERISTFNLAEVLFWRGDLVYALGLALRARQLQTRFLDESPLDALLVARIRCALALWGSDADLTALEASAGANSAVRATAEGEPGLAERARAEHRQAARAELCWVQEHCPPERRAPLVQTLVRLLELLLELPADADRAATWSTLVAEARRTAMAHELQEVLYFAAAAALRERRSEDARRYRKEGMNLTGQSGLWRERFAALPAALADNGSGPFPITPANQSPPNETLQTQSAIH
jgi:tetratricopeptide (TPR) repeat protein